jgi:hypothetical protein
MVTRRPSGGYRAERIMQLTVVLRARETTTLSDLGKRQPVLLCCVISRRCGHAECRSLAKPDREAAIGSTTIAAWPRSTLRITGVRLAAIYIGTLGT